MTTVKFFLFVGSYGGGVKYKGKWYKLISPYGSNAIHYISMIEEFLLDRISCPTWSYDFEKYDILPIFGGSKEKQKEFSNILLGMK